MIRKKAFKRKADCLIIAVWVLGFLPLMVLSACAQNTYEEMKVPDILIV